MELSSSSILSRIFTSKLIHLTASESVSVMALGRRLYKAATVADVADNNNDYKELHCQRTW
jgi:hypothetical protein